MYKKWYGSLFFFLLFFLFPFTAEASHYGLTVKQQQEVLKPYSHFYQEAFSNQDENKDFGMYKIPGLYRAKTLSLETNAIADSSTMTPQGITLTEKYLLISAYSHDHENHSVIYMLDRETHRFIKTVVLPGRPHLGGIAYDPKHQRVWITTGGLFAGLSSIDLKELEDYQLKADRVVSYHQQISLKEVSHASALTYTSGVLVVGYFTLNEYGRMATYRLNDQGELRISSQEKISSFDQGEQKKAGLTSVPSSQFARSLGSWKTLDMIQGIAFYKDYLIMSQSWGPERSGKLYFFDLDKVNNFFSVKDAAFEIDTPPYIEQVSVGGDQLFAVFEGGAWPYRTRNPVLVDHVIQLNIGELLTKKDHE